MEKLRTPQGVTVSYDTYGEGPPLILVHGAFSNHETNWEFVKPLLAPHFTVFAVARRGRGETDATKGHSVLDEAEDVAAIIRSIGQPVFLLGHSYGAQCSLAAAMLVPDLVRKLILYEPPWPKAMTEPMLARLELYAEARDWEQFSWIFFKDVLRVPKGELKELHESPLWAPIVADAKASLGDLRALITYDFQADRFSTLTMPVAVQVGTLSPHSLYATNALSDVLPNVELHSLPSQAHEAMTTAPEMYAEDVRTFLLDGHPKAR